MGDVVEGHGEAQEEVLKPPVEALGLQAAGGLGGKFDEVGGALAEHGNDEISEAFETGVLPRQGGAEAFGEKGS